jgi:hypothetical protein
MRTLTEHLDDLGRMVDSGTGVAKIRNQIAFIGREVAVLETAYARLNEAHSQADGKHRKAVAGLKKQHSKVEAGLKKQIADLKAKIELYDADASHGSVSWQG